MFFNTFEESFIHSHSFLPVYRLILLDFVIKCFFFLFALFIYVISKIYQFLCREPVNYCIILHWAFTKVLMMNTMLLLGLAGLQLLLPLIVLVFTSWLDLWLLYLLNWFVYLFLSISGALLLGIAFWAIGGISRFLRYFIYWVGLLSVNFALNHGEIAQICAKFTLKFVLVDLITVWHELYLLLQGLRDIFNIPLYQIFGNFLFEFLPRS